MNPSPLSGLVPRSGDDDDDDDDDDDEGRRDVLSITTRSRTKEDRLIPPPKKVLLPALNTPRTMSSVSSELTALDGPRAPICAPKRGGRSLREGAMGMLRTITAGVEVEERVPNVQTHHAYHNWQTRHWTKEEDMSAAAAAAMVAVLGMGTPSRRAACGTSGHCRDRLRLALRMLHLCR